MQLKEYQQRVIERLDQYLKALKTENETATDFVEFQKARGKDVILADYCKNAWDKLNEKRVLDHFVDKKGESHIPDYLSRYDGIDRSIPNVCLKVPTGGGKTLLAASAIERINTDYFNRQTGFILWIVPSDSIYKQTWKNLANREHPYRQILERASGGRVRLFEKTDAFTKYDVRESLCVMLLMLQSSARKSKETLRMFRDSGKFISFFPEVDDFIENDKLLGQVPNLDINDLGDSNISGPLGLSIKQSLGNVMKLLRPIVIIDEGHKAYSKTARQTLNGFNPRFILELSATPNTGRERASNVLVDVPGTALKEEQMIRLPINISNYDKADWKYTLAQANDKLNRLTKSAKKLESFDGRYIRPIMLIRVDRTGKDQRDGRHIHAEDAREYLIEKLGINPDSINIKSATLDEIGDSDLLSKFSEVQYIITKDALREGWDCPFAYMLTILSKTTAPTALTQMIGRILRQPEAAITSLQPLNESYVFCFDQEVQNAVESVRKGLEGEGLTGLGKEIVGHNNGNGIGVKKIRLNRKDKFSDLKILLPRILHKNGKSNYRVMDYSKDVLSALDWDSFSFTRKDTFTPDMQAKLEKTLTLIDVDRSETGQMDLVFEKDSEILEDEFDLDIPFMVRQLMDVIPNPWQGMRILSETLDSLSDKEINPQKIYSNRLYLLKLIRNDLQNQIDLVSEEIFRRKLENRDIIFQLVGSTDSNANFELAELIDMVVTEEDKVLHKRNAENFDNCLFEKVYEKEFNQLEKNVAWYLDGNDAIKWWHRLISRQDYYLQGWQRNKIYPDFLVCLKDLGKGKRQFMVLETKGKHLKGNDDTEYKRKLFDLLTQHSATAIEAGEVQIGKDRHKMIFKMLMEDNWKEEISI